jgi:hypothetical protein
MARSKKEIEKKIEELTNNSDNFVTDNYGSEAADNGLYEENFSSHTTSDTLRSFAKWLLEGNK